MDTAFPGSWLLRLVQRMSPRRHWRRMTPLSTSQQARYVVIRMRNILRSTITAIVRSGHSPMSQKPGFSRDWHTSLQRPTDAHRFAEASYRALNYDGAMALISVGPLHNQRGWQSVAEKSLETIELPVKTESDSIAHPTASAYIFDLVQIVDRLLAEPINQANSPLVPSGKNC
jgi:hypothetical protein